MQWNVYKKLKCKKTELITKVMKPCLNSNYIIITTNQSLRSPPHLWWHIHNCGDLDFRGKKHFRQVLQHIIRKQSVLKLDIYTQLFTNLFLKDATEEEKTFSQLITTTTICGYLNIHCKLLYYLRKITISFHSSLQGCMK